MPNKFKKMNCPVDRTTLKETAVENVILQQCPKCGGLWLPPTALKQFYQLHGIDFSSLKDNLDKNTCNINKQILCPSDNFRMTLYPFHGLEIDICTSCWGIWLDGGELELILKKTKKFWGEMALDFGCECVEETSPDIFFCVGDIIVEGSKEIIEFIMDAISSL